MDPETQAPPDGLRASVRATTNLIFRTLQNRAELFGLELEEEGRWIVSALVWAAASIFFAALAITIVTITVVVLVSPDAQPWVLAGFSALYLILAVSAIVGLRRHFRLRRPPMSDTVNELRKDLDWIRPRE